VIHFLIEYVRQFVRFQRNARLYLISNALGGITTGIVLVLYNLYLVPLGFGADFVGVLLLVGTLGAGLAIFPAGVCVDRFSGKAILIWSSLLIGVAGIGLFLFRQPIPLLVSSFVAGIGGAFLLVINAPFLTVNSIPAERPYLFSLNIVLPLVTTVLGKLVGGVLPVWFGAISWLMAPLSSWSAWLLANQPGARSYQLALLFAGVIAGPSLIPLFLMSDDRHRGVDEPHHPHSVPDSFRNVIHRALRREAWHRPVLRSPIFLLSLTQALIGLGAGLIIPYFNIYFVQHLHASSALFGLIDGTATAMVALFTLCAAWLATRVGKVNTIVLTELASIPLLLTIGLTGILPLAAVLYLFRYGLMDMSIGIFQVFSMEVVPKDRRGLANSSYQASFQVPWALAAPLGGLVIVHLGYPPIFVAAAVCYLLSIVILWGKFGRGKRRQFEQREEMDTEEITEYIPDIKDQGSTRHRNSVTSS
jgi:MFS family permease